MPEESKRPFRATDVLTGIVDKAPAAGRRADTAAHPPKPPRRQISLYLTYPQLEMLNNLHHRLNVMQFGRKFERSDLGGLAIQVLDALIPSDRHFSDLAEMQEYLKERLADLS
jgi:hypothetical protein